MPRNSAIVTHPLTNFVTDNLAQAQHDDRLTLHTVHVDSPRSIRNPVILPEDSNFSVADSWRISKHHPKNQADEFSFLDKLRISKRSPHDANGLMQSAVHPKPDFSLLDKPHITERNPGGEDDEQDSEQDDQDENPEIKDFPLRLWIFGDGRQHKRGGP